MTDPTPKREELLRALQRPTPVGERATGGTLTLLGEDHDRHSATFRGLRATWEGDDEIETRRYACSCGARIEVVIRVDVGPPTGDAP